MVMCSLNTKSKSDSFFLEICYIVHLLIVNSYNRLSVSVLGYSSHVTSLPASVHFIVDFERFYSVFAAASIDMYVDEKSTF